MFSGCSRPERNSSDGSGVSPADAGTARQAFPFANIADPSARYTGDAVCASCHEELWSSFQSHGMANSYYPLTAANAVEDFEAPPVRHPETGWYYRAYRADSGFFQEEYRVGAGGAVDHRLIRRMDFVVGSGTAARTYLAEIDGRLYQMPLTWYTQNGRWDFSPGYEVANKRFDRAIPDRCMACHNAFPESVPFVEGKYVDVPNGIGCERCHGPGALHADARLAESEAPDSIDYTILNPAYIGLERQLDVCQQCHLQTTVSLLRNGRDAFEYRPGLPLDEFVSLYYVEDEKEDAVTIDVISHADRMKRSACFVGSMGTDLPLTCTTCHNPHEGFRSTGASYFDTACRSCHSSASLSSRLEARATLDEHLDGEAACSSCHMPKVRATNVVHASFTDHWVRVVKADEEAVTPAAAHDRRDLYPYFASDSLRSDERVYRGMAYVVQGKQASDSLSLIRGRDMLAEELASRRGDYAAAWSLLGWVRLATGDAAGAVNPLREALAIDGPVPERLNTLAQALEASGGDTDEIESAYLDALGVQPAAADIRINYGRFLEQHDRVAEAAEQYRMAAAEQPTSATAHYNLGTAYLRLGQPDEAETSLEEAIHLNPLYHEAMGNLGLLFASTGRDVRAGEMFERALRAAPGSAVANANLGTYLLGRGESGNAVPLLERAVAIDPAYVQARLNLAVAYFQTGDERGARQQAVEVLKIDPSNQRANEIVRALS